MNASLLNLVKPYLSLLMTINGSNNKAYSPRKAYRTTY